MIGLKQGPTYVKDFDYERVPKLLEQPWGFSPSC